MSDQGFARFVSDHGATAGGLVLLVTDDPVATFRVVDQAWTGVYRDWTKLARSPRCRALVLGRFVRAAVRRATTSEQEQTGFSAGVLELRDDMAVGAQPPRGHQVTPLSGREPRIDLVPGEQPDPLDVALDAGFRGLLPLERGLVALSVFADVPDGDLPWALRFRPWKAARAKDVALRDVLLVARSVAAAAPGGRTVQPAAHDGRGLQRRLARLLADRVATGPPSSETSDAAKTFAPFDALDAGATLRRLQPELAAVTQRRALPRPRRAVVVVATCTLVAAGALTAVVLTSDEADEPISTTPSPAAEMLAHDPGRQLVGFRSVYTSVPGSWSHNQLECGQPVANTVIYPDATSGCASGVYPQADVPPSSVTFSPLPTSAVPLGRLRYVNQVGEHGVYATTPVHRVGLYHEIVLIPEADVQMIVRATDIHVMDDIVDSLQAVPEGYAVVPPCQRLMLREAVEQLDAAGLGVKLIQASTLSDREVEPPVTRQTISSGTIVEKGTVVGLGFPSMN